MDMELRMGMGWAHWQMELRTQVELLPTVLHPHTELGLPPAILQIQPQVNTEVWMGIAGAVPRRRVDIMRPGNMMDLPPKPEPEPEPNA